MTRTVLRVLTVLALVGSLAACGGGGGGDSKAEVQAELAKQFAESGLDDAQANCFAKVLIDEIGLDKLKDVDFSADEPPAGLEEDFTAAAMKALSACDIDPTDMSG